MLKSYQIIDMLKLNKLKLINTETIQMIHC